MNNELVNLLPGLLQGITRVSISYPADVVKVQMQKNLHSTTAGTVKHILQTDIRKFYRGSSIAFVTIGLERSIKSMIKTIIIININKYIAKWYVV